MRSRLSSLSQDNLVYDGKLEPGVKPGSENIHCSEGCAAIEMAPPRAMYGILHVPDELAVNTRPDVGRVIASGVPVEPGQIVLVAYGHGKRVTNFWCKGFRAEGEMVFTGRAGGSELGRDGEENQPPIEVEWSESILAVQEDLGWKPCGVQVVLRIKSADKEGGIYLPGKRYECDGEIVSYGDKVTDLTVGETALYHDGALKKVMGHDDLYFCPRRMIYATYKA